MERIMSTVSHDPLPADSELIERTRDLIASQNTMTLATAMDRAAWAAPVYYANLDFNFYFFSDPKSRHIREALENGQASAAVFEPASTWKGIRGVQMSGEIRTLSPGLEALRALRAYLRKYPFTKEFFDMNQSPDLHSFAEKFRVKFFRFKPSLMYYTDNSIRFGFKTEIPLS